MKIALHGIPNDQAGQILLAYEPVWAIGNGGVPAEPEYANQAILWIREAVQDALGQKQADEMPILYGGSVNRDNAVAMFLQPEVDGLFIGRAAWEANSFLELIDLVEEVYPKKQRGYRV